MLASRFWSIVLSLALAAAAGLVQLSLAAHERLRTRSLAEGLSADSRMVSWYLKDAARDRAAHLIPYAASPAIAEGLGASVRGAAALAKARSQVREELVRVRDRGPAEQKQDALFAVNAEGKVVAQVGFAPADRSPDFELGGYAVVADALHGHVRDDTLNLGQLYRVVARPVELQAGAPPVGAVVGARRIDDGFARDVSEATSTAVTFYHEGRRIATAVPSGVDPIGIEGVTAALPQIGEDADYKGTGRTSAQSLSPGWNAVYARLPGEAWQLGAGFAVVREMPALGGPLGLVRSADQKDTAALPWVWLAAIGLGTALVGLMLSVMEHSRPLRRLRAAVGGVVQGMSPDVSPAMHRGPFRLLAIAINEALDKARGQVNSDQISVAFSKVFEDAGQPPSMSAFGLPDEAAAAAQAVNGAAVAATSPKAARAPESVDEVWDPSRKAGVVPPPIRRPLTPGELPLGGPAGGDDVADVEPEWRQVYQDFVAIKRECGESIDGFTFERFTATLRKNRDALRKQHGVSQVHFSAYRKEGRAALRAKPVRS